MKTSFVFTLSEYDGFRVDGATTVNINDVSEFQYTFWSPTTCSLGKKQLYITPKRLYALTFPHCLNRQPDYLWLQIKNGVRNE